MKIFDRTLGEVENSLKAHNIIQSIIQRDKEIKR